MQQRTYQGQISAEELADYLVQHFDPQPNIQAQKIGSGDSLAVQIASGDLPADSHDAITLAIVRAPNLEAGVVVTMGRQQWITPAMAGHVAIMGLVSVLVTPWALFGLLWPIREAFSAWQRVESIWDAINTYALGHGATPVDQRELNHPHG